MRQPVVIPGRWIEVLAHVWPIRHENVNFYGTHSIDIDEVGAGQARRRRVPPLRAPAGCPFRALHLFEVWRGVVAIDGAGFHVHRGTRSAYGAMSMLG